VKDSIQDLSTDEERATAQLDRIPPAAARVRRRVWSYTQPVIVLRLLIRVTGTGNHLWEWEA
jgi:hypothetical protein